MRIKYDRIEPSYVFFISLLFFCLDTCGNGRHKNISFCYFASYFIPVIRNCLPSFAIYPSICFLFLCMSVLPLVPLSLSLILILCQCHAFLIVCLFLLLCCPNFTIILLSSCLTLYFLRTQLFSVGALCALASSSHSFSQQCYKCMYKTFLR